MTDTKSQIELTPKETELNTKQKNMMRRGHKSQNSKQTSTTTQQKSEGLQFSKTMDTSHQNKRKNLKH